MNDIIDNDTVVEFYMYLEPRIGVIQSHSGDAGDIYGVIDILSGKERELVRSSFIVSKIPKIIEELTQI